MGLPARAVESIDGCLASRVKSARQPGKILSHSRSGLARPKAPRRSSRPERAPSTWSESGTLNGSTAGLATDPACVSMAKACQGGFDANHDVDSRLQLVTSVLAMLAAMRRCNMLRFRASNIGRSCAATPTRFSTPRRVRPALAHPGTPSSRGRVAPYSTRRRNLRGVGNFTPYRCSNTTNLCLPTPRRAPAAALATRL